MTAAGSPRARDITDVADVQFFKTLASRLGELHLQAFAAGLAYGAVFALVPTLVLLVTLLGVFNARGLVDRAMEQLATVLPADATALISEQLTSIATTNDEQAFGVGAVISALVALWGASGAMRRVMEALNVVHRVEEARPFLQKVLVSAMLALGAIVTIAMTIAIIALGGGAAEAAFDIIGMSGSETVWNWLRWPLLLVIAWAAIALTYRFAPAARLVGGILTPGTIFATVGWVGFSVLFSWYVGGVGDMSATWGSVAGVIVFLLYLQYTGLIVLVGALVDVVLWDMEHPPSRLRRLLGKAPSRVDGG